MSWALATGESGCTFGTPLVLSGTAADHCDAFSAAGLSDGATVQVCIIKDKTNLAIYGAATYHAAGTITLGSATKTIGTLTAGDSVTVYAVLASIAAADVGAEPTQTAASQAEAEAGTESAIRSFSPLRIFQAIAAKVAAMLAAGVAAYLLSIRERVYTITDTAGFEVDPANGSMQIIVLTASRTPKATNFLEGQSVTLHIDDGTAYTLTWTDSTFGTGGVTWVGATAPTLATSGYTVVQLWKVGSNVYGTIVGPVA